MGALSSIVVLMLCITAVFVMPHTADAGSTEPSTRLMAGPLADCKEKNGDWADGKGNHAPWTITGTTGNCVLTVSSGTITVDSSAGKLGQWVDYKNSITKVVVNGQLTLNNTKIFGGASDNIFNEMPYLESFEARNLTLISGHAGLFRNCPNLTSVTDLNTWDTSKATDISQMFTGCSSLQTLDLSKWDTSSVQDMSYMFWNCPKLTGYLGVSNWKTSNVTNMSYMFSRCPQLNGHIKLNWDTSKVTNMSGMFSFDTELLSVSINGPSSSASSNAMADYQSMFASCSKLDTVDISSLNTMGSRVVWMFQGCTNLSRIALGPNTQLMPTTNIADSGTNDWALVKSLDDMTLVTPNGWQGSVTDLATRMAGAQHQGVYVRAKLANSTSIVKLDANGGILTQSGNDWKQSVSFLNDTVAVNTPSAMGIFSANKPGSLFIGWSTSQSCAAPSCIVTKDGTPITLRKVDSQNRPVVYLYAQWKDAGIPTPTINAPIVSVPDAETKPTAKVTVSTSSYTNGDTLHLESSSGNPSKLSTDITNSGMPGYTWTGDPKKLQTDFGDQYTLTARISRTDPSTGNTITGNNATPLTGTLPYLTVDFKHGAVGESGNLPAPISGFIDNTGTSTNGNSSISLPKPDGINGPDHQIFKHWTTASAQTDTVRGGPWNPGQALFKNNSTDSAGKATVTLQAAWETVQAPTDLQARRDPVTGNVIISGKAKPWTKNDRIVLCYWQVGQARNCFNPISISTGGNVDGFTSYDWSYTASSIEFPTGGTWTFEATLTTNDAAYATQPHPVFSAPAVQDITVDGLGVQNLPLTGGTPLHMAFLMAAGVFTALLLTAAVAHMRNRRRESRSLLYGDGPMLVVPAHKKH